MKVFRSGTAQRDTYDQIVSLLRDGGIIAFPTDTSYGLGADPFNAAAVERIYAIKGRPETKPILLLVDSLPMAESIIQPSVLFYRVAEKFWPGPLTILFRKRPGNFAHISNGESIAVRLPDHSIASRSIFYNKVPLPRSLQQLFFLV